MGEKGRICVTGGGGYQASWLIKLLLFKGYKVQATVREPEAEKNVHLKTFQGASENLQLFKAELLDYDTIFAAIDGCTGVFHVATPVQQDTIPNAEVEIVGTAVTGTLNVLRACSMAKVKRLVVVSSMTAVIYNPNWPRGQPMDESCWSDQETCRTAEAKFKYNMYYLSKTISESKALEYSKETGSDVVTVCPSHILGPALGAPSPSALYIYTILKDMLGNLENKVRNFVDVRDVADALLLVYEKPEAKGRYICSAHKINVRNLVDKLKSMCPNCNLPKVCNVDEDWDLTSEKLLNLGWNYRVLEETLAHTIENFQETGMLEGNIYNT